MLYSRSLRPLAALHHRRKKPRGAFRENMPVKRRRYYQSSDLEKSLVSDLNGMLYVFGGEIMVEGKSVKDGSLALLSNGSEINIQSNSGGEFLILAGPEIGEPIARYGPFVMNTREEIMQAIEDYQRGILA